jgi:hypothetical protein
MMEKNRWLSWLIFLTALITFGYFQSGGGWNQNARFAMVRAMAERAEFSIDSYLIYARAKPDPSTELRRIPATNAEYEINGQRWLLMWPTKGGEFPSVKDNSDGTPVAGDYCPVNNSLQGTIAAIDRSKRVIEVEDTYHVRIPIVFSSATKIQREDASISSDALNEGDAVQVSCGLDRAARVEAKTIKSVSAQLRPLMAFKDLGPVAASGDVAFYRGHFYPNKAPGTSFTAVPVYWLIFHLEKIIGANPDDWWTLTLNAWLTSLSSVGLISALGAVLFFRLAWQFSNGSFRNSLVAVWIFAFGTMFFPNATLFYEHNLIGVALLGSFYLLYRLKMAQRVNLQRDELGKQATARIFVAGLCAGWAAITNYIFIVAVLFLAVYLAFSVKRKVALIWFGAGLLGPFLLICAYNLVCFDTPFTTNYHYQNPTFEASAGHFLGVFNLPRGDVLLAILFSPFRGLFFTAPVLVMSSFGLFAWTRDRQLRTEAYLILAIFLFCICWNSSFNGWDGGVTAVPRYLGPTMPFLALATLYPIARFFKTTVGLAAISAAIMFLITAVDPQPPIGTGAATVLDKPKWQYNPFTEYDLPIFLTQKPIPLLRQQQAQVLHYYDLQLAQDGWIQSARNKKITRIRTDIDRKIAVGEPAPLLLARVRTDSADQYLVADSELSIPVGPVSAHTFGFYGNWIDGGFGSPTSMEGRWNSFNLGEALFPESRWSLLPLLLIWGLSAWRMALTACTSERNVQR